MKKMIFLRRVCFYVTCGVTVCLLSGCASLANKDEVAPVSITENEAPYVSGYKTPQNIGLLKQELKAYYYSGGYDKAINQVGEAALEYLKSCKNMPGKLAVVLDIDEVALSAYPLTEEMDFSYDSVKYDQFIRSGREAAIQPTLKLVAQAQKQGVSVIFLTGRKEEYREVTTSNLKRTGYENWTKIVMRPNDLRPAFICDFKIKEREKITKEGYRIILNLGDQYSDFQGGFYDKGFKYPNPFYYVP